MNAPPPFVIFSSLEKYIQALDPELRGTDEPEIRRLVEKGLPAIASTRSLALAFGYRSQFIGLMCNRPQRFYRLFTIPKGRTVRYIQAPKVSLKIIQKWIGHYLAKAICFPEYVVGFVPGRSAISGASKHCGAEWVFSSDVKDFFQTTRANLVASSLESIGYSPYAAKLISKLTCLDGALAQGSPASPVISNLCFGLVDSAIFNYCSYHQLTYTRYADDIVISGRDGPPSDLREKIKYFVESGGWKLSDNKTTFFNQPRRLKVYGLIVNGVHPRLTKGYRNRIRAIEHLINTGRIDEARKKEAEGHLSYAKSVEKSASG